MNAINSKDKYIFLDIDGVLQPFHPCHRFEVNRKELVDKICEEFNDDFYQQLDEYDVAAVYLDWSEEAVKNLKKLIIETNAKIILSTAWKESKTMKEMKKLFKLHELDFYIADMTLSELDLYREWNFSYAKNEDDLKRMKEIHSNSFIANHLNRQKLYNKYHLDSKKFYYSRELEIIQYIKEKKITDYLILDDIVISSSILLPHFVCINNGYFTDEDYIKALKILKKE